MPQFTVYENVNQNSKDNYPYLLDVQNDLISELKTRVVIPLVLKAKHLSNPISNLNPVFTINKKEYVLLVQQIAGIHSNQLGKTISDLSKKRAQIINAIDFMLTGV